MNESEAEKFSAMMTGLADYYARELSQGTISLYWQGLGRYGLEAVQNAFAEHVRNPDSGQYFPKIADIVRMIEGRTGDQAGQAWCKVDAAVRRIGTYQDVVFDDPIIHRVIADMGGWIKFGQAEEKEWPFIGNRFAAAYRSYKERGEIPEYPPVLTGIANAHNGQHNFALQKPMLIGNGERARQVMLGGTNTPLIPMRPAGDRFASASKLIASG